MCRSLTSAVALALISGSALAESHEGNCALTYETFENAVPHTDMEDCPASVGAEDDSFCRVSVVAEIATVFIFSEESFCLTGTRSFYEDQYTFVID